MSDIKFETINGTLCRMVEPTPLTPEATFPCVARFNTSDHRTINLRNRKPFILRDINNEGYVHYELAYAAHYSLFEIIGYPVVEGSAEWGEYQTQQGIAVRHKHGCVVRPQYDSSSRASIFEHYPTGWQIHEPEPEPEFKVGDWVEYGGKQYQIASVHNNCTFSGETFVMFSGVIWGVSDLTKLRKLKPSEVKVMITLEGTVSQDKILHGASCFTLKTSRSEYIISLHEIEEDELVESLLKAQEEE